MIAYMATFPGRDQAVRHAIKSLAPQVDALQIYCNGYTPQMLMRLMRDLPDNCFEARGEDLGDIGKFFDCEKWTGYVMTADDDIIYPPDYVEKLKAKIDLYERSTVISYHGRIITPPVASFHRAKKQYFPFFTELKADTEVNLLGTGCMGLHTDTLKGVLSTDIFEYTNMTDLYFSLELQSRGIRMMVAEHPEKWLRQQAVPVTIADSQALDDKLETELVNNSTWYKL